MDDAMIERVRAGLLTDPVLEESVIGARPATKGSRIIEVHPLPGVMDPVAQTVRDAVRELTGIEPRVITGMRYDCAGLDAAGAEVIAKRLLANGVIEQVHFEPWTPREFPKAHPADQTLRHVAITRLNDTELMSLSRKGHLFLSLAEMQAIQSHYQERGREPTDIELETLAQTWSEHCVHKTLKSTVNYREEGSGFGVQGSTIKWEGRPGATINVDGSVTISNLLKSTVAAATHELIADGVDWALSVFVDNAGVIAFDEHWAVNVKVETHNRPSAIEPYGGAATGVGGCIRDVIGTGLGSKPIANMDVFCVGYPDSFTTESTENLKFEISDQRSPTPCTSAPSVVKTLPPGVLHPKRVLSRVVDGVRDYGNRMGIPTVNGAVCFDDRYVGNPLVFCGCVGVMPRNRIKGEVRPGDRIIALGGRTGRDGIHGATFSSAELTHTRADEFAHAVQIGNAIEEKRVLDAILRARGFASSPGPSSGGGGGARVHSGGEGGGGQPLYHGLTDCGAGGFSSAIGEMGSKIGASVHLDRAPLKYEGLRYDEIWISESQERMVLAVPDRNVEALRVICAEEGVEMADLGEFGTPGREIVLHFKGAEVGRLECDFLHDGIPMPTREAVWTLPSTPSSGTGLQPVPTPSSSSSSSSPDIKQALLRLLAHPNIASKRWIVRQYDHEVQGNTIIKPLVGPGGIGPGDATVILPVPGSKQGLAIACGLATPVGDPELGGDPYLMAIAAVDECVRNLVCVGADPERIAILDNFCWPSCEKPQNMASLVRAAVGCYDAAKAYRTPFVSGKDSLNNQFRYRDPESGNEITIEIPPTLLISGIGIVPDVSRCVTMDLKAVESDLWYVAPKNWHCDDEIPILHNAEDTLERGPAIARVIADLARSGRAMSVHDCSEGGALVAVSEMLIAAQSDRIEALGVDLDADCFMRSDSNSRDQHYVAETAFTEQPAAYIVQSATDDDLGAHDGLWGSGECMHIGKVTRSGRLRVLDGYGEYQAILFEVPLADLRRAFLGTLDW